MFRYLLLACFVLCSSFQILEIALPKHEIASFKKEVCSPNLAGIESIEYRKWANRFLFTERNGKSMAMAAKLKAFQKKVLSYAYDLEVRNSYGHSPSYFLIDKKTKEPFAILKESNPEFYSSFKQHFPEMPLSAPVWEHELIGYEQDQLFGFNHVPLTIGVRFRNEEGKVVNGVIQEYIYNSKAGVDFYNEKGAGMLLAIPKSHVHALVFSGFFKGISSGHMTNYILQLDESQSFIKSIYEIDLEESMLPFNKKWEGLVLSRMWILGLPQSAEPFDREALLVMAHPGWLSLLQQYQNSASKYSRMDKESWQAQLERVKRMQEIVRSELSKPSITLTPRDLYFDLFGGRGLWEIAQAKHYPALVAFNNLISDPYQHIVKDFAHPENIDESHFLSEDAEESDLVLFFRKMEKMAKCQVLLNTY